MSTVPLRVAIVHYHLRGGGVTRVITRTVRALASSDIEVLVLTGEAPGGSGIPAEQIRTVEGMAYGRGEEERYRPARIRDRLMEQARNHFGRLPDLWHVHNHSLGKNASFTQAVLQLAAAHPVLFHLHDFAEDGRPTNYRSLMEHRDGAGGSLYPRAAHIFYATLNHRDRAGLLEAGLPAEQVQLLPNPVTLPEDRENAPPGALPYSDRRLIVYPTRAIRRKNLGELLLWAALADDDTLFALTLSPGNPAQQEIYRDWKSFSRALDLRVRFEFSSDWPGTFMQLLQQADAVITTSVAEGFGLAFLEPWLAGSPVVGRDLPAVTSDFRSFGIRMPGLYPSLEIPLGWLNHRELFHRLRDGLSNLYEAYGMEPRESDIRQAIEKLRDSGSIDFGRLDEALQRKIIEQLYADAGLREAIQPPRLDFRAFNEELIAHNRSVIQTEFSLPRYGQRLMQLYDKIAGRPVEKTAPSDDRVLLRYYLAPDTFTLLQT